MLDVMFSVVYLFERVSCSVLTVLVCAMSIVSVCGIVVYVPGRVAGWGGGA